MQLRFTSFVVINSRRDLHPQVCAHAGRTTKKPQSFKTGGFFTVALHLRHARSFYICFSQFRWYIHARKAR